MNSRFSNEIIIYSKEVKKRYVQSGNLKSFGKSIYLYGFFTRKV